MCLGLGGSGQKTDRKYTLQGYDDMTKTIDRQGQQGDYDTGVATKRYADLLSGDSSRIMQASAPTINAITSAGDQQRKQVANLGGSRAGGTNAAVQNLSTKEAGEIGNVVAGSQEKAAAGMGALGAQATANSENAVNELTNASINSRPTSNAINTQVSNEWGALAAELLKS